MNNVNYDELPTTVEDALTQTRRLVDGLGKRVDQGIVPVVAALRLMGLPTSASCEGHADRRLYPWVRIETPIPIDFAVDGEVPLWEDLSDDQREAVTKITLVLWDELNSCIEQYYIASFAPAGSGPTFRPHALLIASEPTTTHFYFMCSGSPRVNLVRHLESLGQFVDDWLYEMTEFAEWIAAGRE